MRVRRDVPYGACRCTDKHSALRVTIHEPAPTDKLVSVDACLVSELAELYAVGVVPESCCCGHNQVPGWLTVTTAHEATLLDALGYVRDFHDGEAYRYRVQTPMAPINAPLTTLAGLSALSPPPTFGH